MIIEAIVHPISISRNDKNFDAEVHIPVEVLKSLSFQAKMINLPVTAYHKDTMRSVNLLLQRGLPLTGVHMTQALNELHKKLPTSWELARELLNQQKKPITQQNIWNVLPEIVKESRGPGVLGKVTKFFCRDKKWIVELKLDNILPFHKKLIQQKGAMGEVSLTHHALANGGIEPLEISFTIQGMRTGSAISRIVSMSRNKAMASPLIVDPITPDDMIRNFYDNLGEDQENGKSRQNTFLTILKDVNVTMASKNTASERRLVELEKAMVCIQEATANTLNELGKGYFGKFAQHTPEEFLQNPTMLATTADFVMASLANSVSRQKRKHDELDKVMEEISEPKVVAASRAVNVKSANSDTAANVPFFAELANMRAALKALP
jgi:hypothetical protein